MKIQQIPTSSVIPYERNPRVNDHAVDAVAESIKQFGFRQPIVCDETMTVIVGHTRLKAAIKLGLETVPVHVAEGLTEAQARAYRLADNKVGEAATWDFDMLSVEIDELRDMDFDLNLLGFTREELNDMIGTPIIPPLTDPDETPEVREDAITQPGDVWVLGKHRLMCGDSTDAGSVALLMNGEKADLCFTSPPYGNQRDYTTGGISDWDNLMQGVFACLPISEGGQVLVNLGLIHRHNEWLPYWDGWIEWMRSNGWRRFGLYVWDQGSGLPGDWSGRLAPSHEFIWHFNKKAQEPNKFVSKKPENIKKRTKGSSTMRGKDGECVAFTSPESSAQPNKIPDSVVRINRMHGGHGIDHPAIFPVDLPAFAMQSWPGDCYEPFSGSGTTIIAAEQTGRRCYAMEISPLYVQVALDRWANFTGKDPVREADGVTWSSLKSAIK